MGEVYEATHARLPGRMAVKILRPHLRTNEDAFARFCREAEIMSTVRHPHIIQIIDFNTSRRSMACRISSWSTSTASIWSDASPIRGPLSLAATIRIVDAVASALGAAHAAGVVHRDLKPANIFLMRGEGPDADFVKVIDFGISKPPGSGPELSRRVGSSSERPRSWPPSKRWARCDKIDARTDQFALAAITYAMLTGRQPFVGDNAATLLYQVVHQPHPPLSRFVSWDTTAIQPVLDRALAKRQQDRFEGVVEFARALSAAAGLSTDGRESSAGEPALVSRAPLADEEPGSDRPRSDPHSTRHRTRTSDPSRPSATRTFPAASIVSRTGPSGPSRWGSPFWGWRP